MNRKRAEDTWTTHDFGLLHSPSFILHFGSDSLTIAYYLSIDNLQQSGYFLHYWMGGYLFGNQPFKQLPLRSPKPRPILHGED